MLLPPSPVTMTVRDMCNMGYLCGSNSDFGGLHDSPKFESLPAKTPGQNCVSAMSIFFHLVTAIDA